MEYPKEIYLDGYTYTQMYEHEKVECIIIQKNAAMLLQVHLLVYIQMGD